MGVELVKDRTTKQPFDEAGKLVYQSAFRKRLARISRFAAPFYKLDSCIIYNYIVLYEHAKSVF
jgi:hypothetical protein